MARPNDDRPRRLRCKSKLRRDRRRNSHMSRMRCSTQRVHR